ncbi:U4/U6.U5 tri-snRNP-associated protein 1 [Clonorchis sinensis]|uniref:U4/U6.U5 tri-snRNP-associated protein 1 n=1 Tax=Clonorchis sinensis TaxID=79923 RepID=G7YL41_CLOSI|nr:U4/U6.U5 tri-snRNP-associated protein 1 [Clonorchis sinensis]
MVVRQRSIGVEHWCHAVDDDDDQQCKEYTVSQLFSFFKNSYENSLIELKHRMQDLLASADEDQVLQLVNTLESGQDPSLSPDQLLAEPTSNTAVSSNSFNLRVAAPKDKNIRTLCRNRRAISPAESTTSSSSAASSLTLCARPVKHSVRSSEVRQDTRKINLLDDYLPVQYAVPIESQHKQETKVVPSERMARPTAQTFSDAESSFSSCLNQDGFTVMNPDQLFTLAAALDRQHSSLTNRQQALRQLVRLPINDVQACEAWAHILESEQPDSTASWMESKGPKGKPTQANRSSSFFGIPGQRGVVRSSRSDKPRDTTVCRPLKQPRAGGCLKQGLQDALNDEDGILWSLALRYVCKGLETSPPNIREPFILLIEHVQRLFTSNVERIPHLREDVNMALYPMDRALRAVSLMESLHSHPFLNEVIEQTLNVLVLNRHHQGRWLTGTDFGQINPLCVSSMLDPHAEWFTKWMHGSYSRDPLIRHLRDDPSLVNYSLDIIMGFMNSTQRRTLQTNSFPKAGVDTQLIFSSEEILCALLIHSFSVIHRLLRYTRGRKLFCCSGDSATDCYTVRNTSAKDVICAMLEYVNIKTHYSVEPHSTTHPTEIIVRCLEDLAQLPECCSDLFGDRHVSTGDKRNPSTSNKNPFDLLFAGLMELAVYQQGDNTEIGPDELEYHKLEGQLRIIQRLVSHQAVRCLLQRSRCSQSNHEGRPLALLSRTIAWLVETLTNQVGPVHQYTETEMPLRAIFMMIQISRGLTTLSSSEKLDEFDHYCDLVIRTYKQLNAVAIPTSQSSEGNQSILKRLCLQLSEYPAGVARLQRAGLLEECGQTLTDMLTEWDSLPEPRLLGRILTNLTSTRDGMQALMAVGIIKSLISDVWRSVEIGEVSNSSATQLQWDIPSCGSRVPTWSTDPIDRIAYKPFVRLVRATCSYAGLDALLNDAAENQSTTYGRRFTPTSLQEFFQRTLSIPNDKNQSQSLYNSEETIVLALRLLSCMVSDLNVMLALECRFRLIDGLLKDHRDAVTSNESLQLDAVTIERNYLLVKCNVIGGPDERRIPPRSLCEHLSNPYPYPIIINELDEETAAPFDHLTSQQYPVTSCIKSPCFPWYAQLYPSDPVSTRLDEFSTLSLSVFYSNALFNKPIDSKSVAEEWYRTCLASLVSSASTEKLANSCVKSHALLMSQDGTGNSDKMTILSPKIRPGMSSMDHYTASGNRPSFATLTCEHSFIMHVLTFIIETVNDIDAATMDGLYLKALNWNEESTSLFKRNFANLHLIIEGVDKKLTKNYLKSVGVNASDHTGVHVLSTGYHYRCRRGLVVHIEVLMLNQSSGPISLVKLSKQCGYLQYMMLRNKSTLSQISIAQRPLKTQVVHKYTKLQLIRCIIIIVIDSMTPVFNTDASLPYSNSTAMEHQCQHRMLLSLRMTVMTIERYDRFAKHLERQPSNCPGCVNKPGQLSKKNIQLTARYVEISVKKYENGYALTKLSPTVSNTKLHMDKCKPNEKWPRFLEEMYNRIVAHKKALVHVDSFDRSIAGTHSCATERWTLHELATSYGNTNQETQYGRQLSAPRMHCAGLVVGSIMLKYAIFSGRSFFLGKSAGQTPQVTLSRQCISCVTVPFAVYSSARSASYRRKTIDSRLAHELVMKHEGQLIRVGKCRFPGWGSREEKCYDEQAVGTYVRCCLANIYSSSSAVKRRTCRKVVQATAASFAGDSGRETGAPEFAGNVFYTLLPSLSWLVSTLRMVKRIRSPENHYTYFNVTDMFPPDSNNAPKTSMTFRNMSVRVSSIAVIRKVSDVVKRQSETFFCTIHTDLSSALRAKLGLAPLELDDDKGEGGIVDNQSENYVHAPAKDLRKHREEEALKQKLAVHKEKRSLYDKLASSTLYEPSEKDMSAMSWVEKIREKERIKKQAQARAKLLSEMDEQLDAELPPKVSQYESSDLTGLKVEHKIDSFREGQTVILTLKDKDVLEEEADTDVLVNVNIVDDEKADRNRENMRKTAGLAGIADEEDEDVLLGLRQKSILSKYDADISGPKSSQFVLGSEGTYVPQTERMLEQLNAELRAGKQSLPDTELRVASEYFTHDELQAKFKKRTRRVKTRVRSALTADDLTSSDQQLGLTGTSDLGKRSTRRTDSDDVVHAAEQPSSIDLMDALSASTSYGVNQLESVGDQLIGEDELRGEIEKTISRIAQAKSGVYVKPEEVAAQLLARGPEKSEPTESLPQAGKPENRGGVVFDSTAEFYKSIGAGLQETIRQNAPLTQIKAEYSDDEVDIKQPLSHVDWGMARKEDDHMSMSDEHDSADEQKPNSNRWHTVGDGQVRRTRPAGRTDVETGGERTSTNTQLGGVLDDEPSLDCGVFSALKLAEKKGYIEKGQEKRTGTGTMVNLMAKHFVQEDVRYDDIDAKFAKRDRYSGPLTEFKEIKNYKPDVKLEYVDELGRQLNSKEAFRQLSHKFHGKGSGKNKTEKRMKKIKEEFLLKASTSSDTPLGTAEKLNKKLQSMALPYVILSGKNAAVLETIGFWTLSGSCAFDTVPLAGERLHQSMCSIVIS